MSSRVPTTIRFSFERFAQRGGANAPHADGWGVAFFEGKDVRLLREPEAAAASPLARLIEAHGPSATIVISHIRRATQGARTLANAQPFTREIAGRMHAFAHNGDLIGITHERALVAQRFRPVGETDSELAFCVLLERLAQLWRGPHVPPIEARAGVIAEFARALRALGPANFLYSDGDALFAHADRRHQQDGSVRPPGLWRLERECIESQESPEANGISVAQTAQRVVLFASVPLTAEPWQAIEAGGVVVAQGGELRIPQGTSA